MPAKILVIGVDSGDPDLLERWCASGDMPNITALRAKANWGRVQNPQGLEIGSVWASFHTGLKPGNQPQFDGLRHFDPDRYSFAHYDSTRAARGFWQETSAAGKRTFVFDAPYTHVDPAINGIHIVDYGTHVSAKGSGNLELTTQPPQIRDEILEQFGPDPLGGVPCDDRLCETISDYQAFRNASIQRIRTKARIAKHYLQKEDWDYFEVVFCDLHCMGHHLWHIGDPNHPRFDPAYAEALGDPLRDGYRALDAAAGEILSAVGPETVVLVYASHGMGPQYTGTGLLDRILERLETGAPPKKGGLSVKGRIRKIWRSIPTDIRERIRPLTRSYTGILQHPTFLPNRSDRKLFEIYVSNAAGGVRVNLMGREANGQVSQADYDALLDRVSADLRDIVNRETGEPLVDHILKTRESYSGPFVDTLPDLIVGWNRSKPIRVVESPKIGVVHQEYMDARTGDHSHEGIYYASGPGILSGPLNSHVASVDFLPTFRAILGMAPQPTDGRPIASLVSSPPATHLGVA